ncbi:MAG TPA: hypothetical protein VFT57_03085 [Gemmatimonadaceae bacterium]|nr:hypothetical protein [Gemmatimonadaceae bacterium]
MNELTVLDAGHAEDEADDFAVFVESAGGYSADALGDFEDGGGDAFTESRAPDGVLEGDAGDELFVRGEVTDLDFDARGFVRDLEAGIRSAAARVARGRHMDSAFGLG